MNYDTATEEGMANAVEWTRQLIAQSTTETFVWLVPRSGAVYTIDKPTLTYSVKRGEGIINTMLEKLGYTKKVLQ